FPLNDVIENNVLHNVIVLYLGGKNMVWQNLANLRWYATAVNNAFTRLAQVFQYIGYRAAVLHFHNVQLLKVVSSELPLKKIVGKGFFHLSQPLAVFLFLRYLADHFTRGNVQNTMKMQPVRFLAAFPNAHK